jgi:AcrR family transcriptional regulator
MTTSPPAPARSGDSGSPPSLRERQREAARGHVAGAAGPLFLEKGYAGTTTKAIAAAAGVSEGTVYNYFGSKPEVLLEALRRLVPIRPGELDAIRDELAAMPDGDAAIREFCRHDEEVAQRALPLVRVFLEAAATDTEVAARWRAQEEVRLESQTSLLDVLGSRGWLRTDVPRDMLARQLWLTVSPEIRLKWADTGLPVKDHLAWKETALRSLLLPPEAQAVGVPTAEL